MITFLRDNPSFGFISSLFAMGVNSVKEADLIPHWLEDITFYLAALFGLGIAILTFVGLVRKEYKAFRARKCNVR